MFIEIIEERENNVAYGEDLIYAVGLRWILLFLAPNLLQKTTSLGIRLFYRVWASIEYPGSRFKESFLVIPKLLTKHFNQPSIYLPVLAIMFGSVIETPSWSLNFDVPTLMALLKPKQTNTPTKFRKKNFTPEIFPSLVSLISTSVKSIAENHKYQSSEKVNDSREYSNLAQTVIGLLASMYMQVQPLRELLALPETLEELLTLLYSLISSESPYTIEQYQERLRDESSDISPSNHRNLLISLVYIFDLKNCENESRFVGDISKFKSPHYKLHSELQYLEDRENAFRQNIEGLVELILIVYVESILDGTKSVSHIESLLYAFPLCSERCLSEFQEFIGILVMDALALKINRRKIYLQDAKVVNNLVKFSSIFLDWVEQGKSEKILDISDFIFMLAKYVFEFEEEALKSGAKLSFEHQSLMKQLNRMVLFRFRKLEEDKTASSVPLITFLRQITIHQNAFILSSLNNDGEFIKCIMHHFISYLCHNNTDVVQETIKICKKIMMIKHLHIYSILKSTDGEYQKLVDGFSKLLDNDHSLFLQWHQSKNQELEKLFQEATHKIWEECIISESRYLKDVGNTVKANILHKLKKKTKSINYENAAFTKFSEKSRSWLNDIQSACIAQRQKFKIDYKLMQSSLESEWKNLLAQLGQEHAILAVQNRSLKWKLGEQQLLGQTKRSRLDFTEGRARTRKKFRPNEKPCIEYQSKADKIMETLSPALTETHKKIMESLRLNENFNEALEAKRTEPFASGVSIDSSSDVKNAISKSSTENIPVENEEDEWEEVKLEENYMKIQRLLQPGDTIIEIVNCARLVGLELIGIKGTFSANLLI